MDFFKSLSSALLDHDILKKGDLLTKDNYQEFVKEFQSRESLQVTGETDAETLWALQYDIVKSSALKTKAIVSVAPFLNCNDSFLMRDDVVGHFKKAMAEIVSYGSKVYSSGALRQLDAPVSTGRSATSLHYTGLALDLCINAGFGNPQKDPYVLVRERFDSDVENWDYGDYYFKIYFRSPYGQKMNLKAIYWENHESGVDLFEDVEDSFVCLSEIMYQHGFGTIAPHPDFLDPGPNRPYLSSEWWHFNASWLLTKGFSVFGIELLKLYSEEVLEKNPPWEYKKAIFKGAGFVTDTYVPPWT